MRYSCGKLSLMICCSVAALAMPAAAQAQDANKQAKASDAPATTNEIVVTATRQSQRLQEVAMSVNVATGEQLQKFAIFDVKDVSQLAPGLELTNTTGRNNTTTLRGITFDPDQGTQPAVQVYYNEVPVDAQTAYTAIYDIKQIEVLRGPQGLLRGLSAPAGSITIATARPNFDHVEGYADATATDHNGYNVQGAVTLPFSDTLSIRAAAMVDGNRGNFVTDVNTGGRSYVTTESVRLTLGWRPAPNFTAYLTYQYLNADNRQYQQVIGTGNTPLGIYSTLFGTPAVFIPPAFGGGFKPDLAHPSGPPLGVGDYGAVEDGVFRNQNNTHLINLAMDWNLGPATLSFVGNHQGSVLNITRDLDVDNAIPGYIQNSTVHTPYLTDTAELRLSSNNHQGLTWGVSAFYEHQGGDTYVDQAADLFMYAVAPNAQVNPPCALVGGAAAGCTGAFAPYTIPNMLPLSAHIFVPVNVRLWSFSGNLGYKAGPLSIQAGLRWTTNPTNQSTQETLTGFFNVPAHEIIPAALQHSNHQPVTGGATIDYAVTDSLNAYLAYGHAYRVGSTGVAAPPAITNDLIQTHPEQTDSYEIGLKGSALDHRLNFTVSGYYQKINGYLARFTSIYYTEANPAQPNGFFDFNYNGNATIKGIEAMIDARPTPNWDLNMNAALTHARWDNARLPCNDFGGTGIPNQNGTPAVTGSGNVSYCNISDKLSNTPDFSLTANTEVRFPMATVTPFVRALVAWTPAHYWWQSQYDIPDRELVNLFVGVRTNDGKWEIDGFVRNLLDQRRITNIGLGTGQANAIIAGTFQSGYTSVNVTNPREFGLTAKVKW